MIRSIAFLVVILVGCISAHAKFAQAAGITGATCPTPNNVAGATVTAPAQIGCGLVPAYFGPAAWSFGTGGGPNYPLSISGYKTVQAVTAELCAGPPGNYNPYVGIKTLGSPNTYTALGIQYGSYGLIDLPSTAICTPAINFFVNKSKTTPYNTAQQLNDAALPGNALVWKAPPSGIPSWNVTTGGVDITKASVTITIESGYKVYGAVSPEPPGQGSVIIDADNVTIQGAKDARVMPEIAFVHDTNDGDYRCIGMDSDVPTALTVNGPLLIHDCDFGLITANGTGVGGALTLGPDLTFDHNGDHAANQGSAVHNIYVGEYPSAFNISGTNGHPMQSYCVGNVSSTTAGFEIKSRAPTGTFVGYVASETDPILHHTDCTASAAVDLSQGGKYVLGGTGTGLGGVVELGLNEQNTNGSAIRYAAESVYWKTNSLLVQNHWIILDEPGNPTAVYNPHNQPVTVKNSKIVCNGKQACTSLATILGANVTDGGGNTLYASRAAAGLGDCVSETNCPLPRPM